MHIEEVVDTNDAREGNVPSNYFVEEERKPISDIVNLDLVEEQQGSAITPILTLLRHQRREVL